MVFELSLCFLNNFQLSGRTGCLKVFGPGSAAGNRKVLVLFSEFHAMWWLTELWVYGHPEIV